jgi:hypothetical protein
MATIVVLTLLAFVQAVFGRPIDIDAFYNLGNGLTSIIVSLSPATCPVPNLLTFWVTVDPGGAPSHKHCSHPLDGCAIAP